MALQEPIPLQAGDSSTDPTQQPMAMVPFDADDGVDTDMGFILDLQKRNEEMQEEAALSEQIVQVGSSSSYGPAPALPPSKTKGFRQKYDLGPKDDDISPFNLTEEVVP